MLNKFLNILFPESCPVCGKQAADRITTPICSACWHAIQPYEGPICRKCGKPLSADTSITCRDCIDEEPAFKYARSFGLYEGTLKEAVNLLKYRGVKRLSKPLSEIMFAMLDNKHLTGFKTEIPDAVIPVPLHRQRLRQREFNQAALLAKNIAGRLGIPVLLNCLVKIRDTAPQVGLKAKERKKNIRKAFEIINNDLIQKKRVLLVDDVFTTGATVRECSGLLKKAGAGDIYVITLAHGIGDI